jgi:1-deoxy-D-xylulose-5-phosphate synthase
VVLNDNRMSIGPAVGGLSKYLSRLSMTQHYQHFRLGVDTLIRRLPIAGKPLERLVLRLKRAVKAAFYHDNFFVDLGFEYAGPIDGHNLEELLAVLRDVRALHRPVVVHVITQKGRGYAPAERDPGAFHSVPPFDAATGVLPTGGASWTRVFGDAMLEAGRADGRVVALSAAMERGTGLARFHAAFPDRFFDTGITEAHTVTFAAGLASRGLRPVVAIYSTFIQRACDSVIHDVGIERLPVVFALDRAGFVAGDGETHQGLFDIALFRAVPGMTILAPATDDELRAMLAWALAYNGPVMLRYPKDAPVTGVTALREPLTIGRGVLLSSPAGKADICLACVGSLYREAAEAAAIVARENAIPVDIYNFRFLKPLDEEYLIGLLAGYRAVVVVEEGVAAGGIGEAISALVCRASLHCQLYSKNAGDSFYPSASRKTLLQQASLDADSIARFIVASC